jgi:hypothetical protein
VVGYDATGIRLRNTWGPDWSQHGEATMTWAQFSSAVWEVWKAVDVIDKGGK